MAEDALAVMQTVFPKRKFHVFGIRCLLPESVELINHHPLLCSMGGMIAQELTLLAPQLVERLVLVQLVAVPPCIFRVRIGMHNARWAKGRPGARGFRHGPDGAERSQG